MYPFNISPSRQLSFKTENIRKMEPERQRLDQGLPEPILPQDLFRRVCRQTVES